MRNRYMKQCGKCHREFEESCFSKNKSKRDGLQSFCKECACLADRQWYKDHTKHAKEKRCQWRKTHPDRVKEHGRKWREAHPEYLKEARRKWREANPERKKELYRQWREANLEHTKERTCQWNKAHPEHVRAIRHRRRAREVGNGGSFTVAEWLDLCRKYGNVCLACGKAKPLTADHIKPISRGGTSNIDNIQPLCKSCNCRKRDKEIDYRLVQTVLVGMSS